MALILRPPGSRPPLPEQLAVLGRSRRLVAVAAGSFALGGWGPAPPRVPRGLDAGVRPPPGRRPVRRPPVAVEDADRGPRHAPAAAPHAPGRAVRAAVRRPRRDPRAGDRRVPALRRPRVRGGLPALRRGRPEEPQRRARRRPNRRRPAAAELLG